MKSAQVFVSAFLMLIASAAFAAPVNINTADAVTLSKEMKGVGAKKAEAIVAYRTANGPFKSVDDLTKVDGVAKSLIEKNRTNLTVK